MAFKSSWKIKLWAFYSNLSRFMLVCCVCIILFQNLFMRILESNLQSSLFGNNTVNHFELFCVVFCMYLLYRISYYDLYVPYVILLGLFILLYLWLYKSALFIYFAASVYIYTVWSGQTGCCYTVHYTTKLWPNYSYLLSINPLTPTVAIWVQL